MTDSTTNAAITTVEENSFIEDQQPLQSPMGVIMTLGDGVLRRDTLRRLSI